MIIPTWLSSQIPTHCECGGLIVNNDALTVRMCSNAECYLHNAAKLEAVAKYFGIKNVGIATAKEIIREHNLTYHLDGLKYIMKSKPSVYLHEVGVLAMLRGHDKDIQEYARGFKSFKDFLPIKDQYPFWFQIQLDDLIKAESYFDVKPPVSRTTLNVMLTGTFHGWPSRDDFIKFLNDHFGMYVYVNNVGVRKTNVDFLICEEDAAFHNKMAIAKERGIPIITPAKFAAGIVLSLREKGVNISDEDAGIRR